MELDIIKRNFRRLEYGNLRHNTESQDGVLLVNSTATYFENDRILLEEAVVGNQPMSVMIQEGQYGIQSDVPGFTILSVTLKGDVIRHYL